MHLINSWTKFTPSQDSIIMSRDVLSRCHNISSYNRYQTYSAAAGSTFFNASPIMFYPHGTVRVTAAKLFFTMRPVWVSHILSNLGLLTEIHCQKNTLISLLLIVSLLRTINWSISVNLPYENTTNQYKVLTCARCCVWADGETCCAGLTQVVAVLIETRQAVGSAFCR